MKKKRKVIFQLKSLDKIDMMLVIFKIIILLAKVFFVVLFSIYRVSNYSRVFIHRNIFLTNLIKISSFWIDCFQTDTFIINEEQGDVDTNIWFLTKVWSSAPHIMNMKFILLRDTSELGQTVLGVFFDGNII